MDIDQRLERLAERQAALRKRVEALAKVQRRRAPKYDGALDSNLVVMASLVAELKKLAVIAERR